MSRTVLGCLLLVSAATYSPAPSQAQLFRGLFDNCCTRCQRPPAQCACVAAHPVVETQYRQQQQVTYQDIPHTEYRQEAYYQSVPVTAYQNVTVDEGAYQQVWVPRLVTKQVPMTTYQQQLAYRSVPHQTTRRVAQVHTQMVPQQTVRYVHQTHTLAHHHGCNTCGTTALPAPVAVLPVAPAVPTLANLPPIPVVSPYAAPTRTAANIPTMPSLNALPERTAELPTLSSEPFPDPRFARSSSGGDYEEWQTVESRNSRTALRDDRFGGYQAVEPRRDPLSERTSNRSGLFVPAPSAASVWQSQRTLR